MSQPDYSWAEYLDYMEGGGSDVLTLPAARPIPATTRKDQPIWGILLALLLTLLALWASELPFWPFTISSSRHPIEPVMLAIILGMVVGNVWALPAMVHSGIKFSVKKLLPLGIVLLGAKLNFQDLLKVGFQGLVMSMMETVVALTLLLILTRFLKLPKKLGVLLGVGTAICGGTAIVATAPVIEAEEKDVVFSVATVTLLGLIAMFTLPVIGHMLELSPKAFGIWAGLSIHQTPQVVAAGFAYAPEAGQVATIVKLARVCLLAPVVFIIGFVYARRKSGEGRENKRINYLHLFPTFVLGFLGVALLNTLGLLPQMTAHSGRSLLFKPGDYNLDLAKIAEQISRFFITISMAGVGLETKFSSMRKTGLKPFAASLIAVIFVAGLILALLRWSAIG